MKYTKSGSVSLTVGLTGDMRDPELLIAVRDTGDGISPEAQAHIFERFVRSANHQASAEPGVGLGLSMCRSLAELLGGSLGCESVLGKGSYFWARLPVTADPDAVEETVPTPLTAAVPVLWLTPPHGQTPELSAPPVVSGMDALVRVADADPPMSTHVLIVDLDHASEEARERLQSVLADERPPALIVLSAAAELSGDISAAATAIVTPSQHRELDGTVATVARWHWRVTQQFDAAPVEVTALIRRLTVLVADDNALNRDVTQRMLELDGHRVILAETGDEALHHLLDGEAEVAFLDVNMPGMSGIEACRSYKTGLGSGARVPVIGLTADISERTRQDCLRAGMEDVLGKPVTLEHLRGALADLQLAGGSVAASAAGTATAAETDEPVVDESRIAFVRQLFGEEKFRNHFLASFKRDVGRNLELLRQGVASRRGQCIGDALHAIKSSACTAGAKRLFRTVERPERAEGGATGAEFEIQTEFRSFCDAVEALRLPPDERRELVNCA